MAINNQGWVAGWSQRSDGTRRAALWRADGSATLLGTLGGPSSTVPWPGLNDAGLVVGISQTGETDPLGEDWACEFGGFFPNDTDRLCRGFFWDNNVMRGLPTLGGNHGFATGVNNRGQIVGWAETAVEDETCDENSTQVLQFRAVLWEPKSGSSGRIKATELVPFGATRPPPPPRSTTMDSRSASRGAATRRWAASAPSTRCCGTRAASRPRSPTWAVPPGTPRWTSTPRRRGRLLQPRRAGRRGGRLHLPRLPLGQRLGHCGGHRHPG